MKTIVLTAAAAKDLDALPPVARQQVTEGLVDYAVTGRGDVKGLAGREGYRLRIGRYRVIFNEDRTTILAVYIGKRETSTYGRNGGDADMSSIQIIKTPAGEEMVILPKSDYDELVRIAEEAAEDAADIAIYDSRIKEMSEPLPAEVSMAILRGVSRLKAMRNWRGLTQNELASAVGVGQGFISDLESRRRTASGKTVARLAATLDVPREWLEG